MCLANCMSFGMIVMHALHAVCTDSIVPERPTKKVSPASCRAIIAVDCRQRSAFNPCTISFTTHWNGSLLISNSVPLWYFFISLRALNPLFTLLTFPSLCFCLPSFSSCLSPFPFHLSGPPFIFLS